MRAMKEFKLEELVEATHNYSKSHLIGKGSHGCIYKATLKNGQTVAIKTPSLGLCKLQDTSKIENEAHILSSVSRNRFLVNLLGTNRNSSGHMIAHAVQFLHESKPLIIHRDIKSENILFDSKSNARLADFGLVVCISSYDSLSQLVDSVSLPAGTIGYLDPSYTTPCKLSTKNDVFSFGVVLLEIVSGTKAIDVSRVPASIVEWSMRLMEENRIMEICDRRVNMPRHMKRAIRHMLVLAIQCVSSDEELRPSMTEVVTKMPSFKVSIWLDMIKALVKIQPKERLVQRCQHHHRRSTPIPLRLPPPQVVMMVSHKRRFFQRGDLLLN
ncbi:hypothetical protein L1987_54989 [Smallanthus sonchifolius]|uniref:Uncharacterized protein n=1 Tax=Smallanthus sonchifolius TaxID=185202 RepID=A0ACB9E8G6_9ASTR|nr:hypothetical protein L1987_54989 [Smallanthus sonchifolius]